MQEKKFLLDVKLLGDMTDCPEDNGIVLTNNQDEYEIEFESVVILDEFIDLLIKRRNQVWPYPQYQVKA